MSPAPTPTPRKPARSGAGWRAAANGWRCMAPAAAAPSGSRVRKRRTVKAEHHALLGSYFLTHPPICEFRVEVRDRESPLTRGLGTSFVVEDEPYFIELQDPGATHDPVDRRLRRSRRDRRRSTRSTRGTPRCKPTARPGSSATPSRSARAASPITRSAIATTRRSAPPAPITDPADKTPPIFRAPWETDGFITLLRNAIAWGMES